LLPSAKVRAFIDFVTSIVRDGAVRMPHYCGAGNQPRLKATSIDPAANVIRFELVDITNLHAPDAPHVHGFTMHLVDANHIELEFLAKGKQSVEHIELTPCGREIATRVTVRRRRRGRRGRRRKPSRRRPPASRQTT